MLCRYYVELDKIRAFLDSENFKLKGLEFLRQGPGVDSNHGSTGLRLAQVPSLLGS